MKFFQQAVLRINKKKQVKLPETPQQLTILVVALSFGGTLTLINIFRDMPQAGEEFWRLQTLLAITAPLIKCSGPLIGLGYTWLGLLKLTTLFQGQQGK
jgi:hypothetical protein